MIEAAIAKEVAKEVAEVAKTAVSEVGKLPDKLGRVSEVKGLADRLGKSKETQQTIEFSSLDSMKSGLGNPFEETVEKSREFASDRIDKAALDKPIDSDADSSPDIRNCPVENGQWEGERGNSKWKPDPEYVPKKSNPQGKTWGEILEEHGVDGIKFIDGEPVFDDVSKGTVKIEGFSSHRDDNFDKADIEMAKQRGCTPEEVKKWRKENGYTWHECKDMETMQKVPSEIHNNIPHRGGVSNAKSLEN